VHSECHHDERSRDDPLRAPDARGGQQQERSEERAEHSACGVRDVERGDTVVLSSAALAAEA
jgi:hypothetical protein